MAQAFGDGRQPGVRIVEPFQGGVGAVLRRGAPGLGGGEGEPLAFQLGGHGGQPCGGVVDGGLHLEQRGRLRGAAADRQRGEDVPGRGHGGQVRARRDQLRRVVQVRRRRRCPPAAPDSGSPEASSGPDAVTSCDGPPGARRQELAAGR